MARRRLLTVAGLVALLLAVVPTVAATATGSSGPWPGPIMARPVPPLIVDPPLSAPPLANCEHVLERAHHRGAGPLAIVGASFTAGVGPGTAGRSWAALLARMLRTDAVVDGVPGAGYVHAGQGHRGPMAALLTRIGLRDLDPSLVIIQAGHDDIGVPTAIEQQRVKATIALIRAQAPAAKIALLTVFTRIDRHRSFDPAAAQRTDHAIVSAARAADPGVIIIDPLAAHWSFPRVPGGLHPTAGGDVWIAHRVALALQEHGVRRGPASAGTTLVCDSGISPVRSGPKDALLSAA
jgi:acyl-CoA thioesterase I